MAITNTALAQAISDFLASQQDRQDEFADWLGGVVGGGPGNDGRYPLTDHEGNTVTVASPAQMEADLDALIDAGTGSAAEAAASATAAASSASTATTQAGLAATARTGAETAETNAETAQAAAESARNTAIAQANAASASATAAAASEAAALAAQSAAEAAAGSVVDPGFDGVMTWDNTANQAEWVSIAEFARIGTANVFTAGQRVSAAVPYWSLLESDASADNQRWYAYAQGETFYLSVATDADVHTNFMAVDRTAGAVDAITFSATRMDLPAVVALSGGDAYLSINESDATADNGKWRWRAVNEQFRGEAYNDADNLQVQWVTVDRTGTTVDEIAWNSNISVWKSSTGTEYGRFSNGGSLQITGGFSSGYAAAAGLELGVAAGAATIQAYDRNASAYINLSLVANLIGVANGLVNAANDANAASAGIGLNQLYRNGSVVQIRVS